MHWHCSRNYVMHWHCSGNCVMHWHFSRNCVVYWPSILVVCDIVNMLCIDTNCVDG